MTSRILVVDDDTALAEMIGIVLRTEGFDPVFCADGAAAVDEWRAQRPDLVLLDLMLPGMDGIEVCTRIRAESGVPTFRDALTGLWANFRPEELATEDAFRRDPARVWDWYQHRRRMLRDVLPNAGHHALAAFQQRHPGRLTLVTQNVDGLHQRAGSVGVLCLHGDLFADRWLDPARACCRLDAAVPGSPPHCGHCGNLVRPGVVWFGEALPLAELEAAERAAHACDVMLVAGTSGQVYPAAAFGQHARRSGAHCVELNLDRSAVSRDFHEHLIGPATQIVPEWVTALD